MVLADRRQRAAACREVRSSVAFPMCRLVILLGIGVVGWLLGGVGAATAEELPLEGRYGSLAQDLIDRVAETQPTPSVGQDGLRVRVTVSAEGGTGTVGPRPAPRETKRTGGEAASVLAYDASASAAASPTGPAGTGSEASGGEPSSDRGSSGDAVGATSSRPTTEILGCGFPAARWVERGERPVAGAEDTAAAPAGSSADSQASESVSDPADDSSAGERGATDSVTAPPSHPAAAGAERGDTAVETTETACSSPLASVSPSVATDWLGDRIDPPQFRGEQVTRTGTLLLIRDTADDPSFSPD